MHANFDGWRGKVKIFTLLREEEECAGGGRNRFFRPARRAAIKVKTGVPRPADT